MTRAEFERRYSAMPHVNKAELIEGIVYMPSPVRQSSHGKPHVILSGWLSYYISKTSGLDDFGDNTTVRLDDDNEPQPDLHLMLPTHAGGKAKVDDDGYVNGTPELICEVAASSVSIDLHAKLNAYRRNGVREYLVWKTEDSDVAFLILRDGKYETMKPGDDAFLKSQMFPGLWLDPQALLQNDLPKLFAAIDKGVATAEHAAFVDRLKSK